MGRTAGVIQGMKRKCTQARLVRHSLAEQKAVRPHEPAQITVGYISSHGRDRHNGDSTGSAGLPGANGLCAGSIHMEHADAVRDPGGDSLWQQPARTNSLGPNCGLSGVHLKSVLPWTHVAQDLTMAKREAPASGVPPPSLRRTRLTWRIEAQF